MPKFFGRRSKSGFVGPFGSFFGCFALMAAGAGAGFLLGAYDAMKTNHTGASSSVFSFESLASLLLPSDSRVLSARKALSPRPARRPR